MKPSLRLLLLSSLVAAALQAQDPLSRLRAAVLAGREAEARALLASASEGLDPARMALLELSLRPPVDRARGCLALCRIERDGAAVDRALLAGAGALLAARSRGDLAAGLKENPAQTIEADDHGSDALLTGLDEVLRARTTAGGDRELLAEARWMLATAAVSHVRAEPVFLPTGTVVPVPAPLEEALEVRFLPWDLDRDPLLVYREQDTAPIAPERLAAVGTRQEVALPGPGVWMLELTGARGWKQLRRVVVTDLVLHALIVHDALCVLAEVSGAPAAGVRITARCDDDGGVAATTDARGIATLQVPRRDVDVVVTAERAEDRVRVRARRAVSWNGLRAPQLAHLMVDRPLYRPGETVRGRVLLRAFAQHQANGLAPRAVTGAPGAGREVELTFWPRTPWQRRLAGVTDAAGVFAFELPLPPAAPRGDVEVAWTADSVRAHDHPFRVVELRRPALLASLECPTSWEPRQGPLRAVAMARFAAGAPAAGVEVVVRAWAGDRLAERRLRLDALGRAEVVLLPAEAARWPDRRIGVDASFTGPDGQVVREACSVELPGGGWSPRDDRTLRITATPDEPEAGSPLRVEVTGPAHANVLLVAYRDRPFVCQRVVLDARGVATLSIPTARAHWPQIELCACLAPPHYDGDVLATASVRLALPGGRLVCGLAAPASVAPGGRACIAIRTADAHGRPVAATVAVAVVDERIFRLAADRTADPFEALRPRMDTPQCAVGLHALLRTPLHLLGELLHGGRLELAGGPSGATTPGPSGPGYPGSSGEEFTRERFEATALFLPAVATDAEGRAEITCPFPHDLTRWRITAVAADRQGRAALATRCLETSLPLSVTPLVPRTMRVGDALAVPVVVAAAAVPAGMTSLHADAGGGALRCVGGGDALLLAGAGAPVEASLALFAERPGDATLSVSAAAACGRDTARLRVPVAPDRVVRSGSGLCVAIAGARDLAVPEVDGRPASRARLVLFGAREALLSEAARHLAEYPHGCVEQICSRLAPLLAARAAASASGAVPKELERQQSARIDAAFVALRGHLLGPGQGFRWYHGDQFHPGMTALALGTLGQAAELGIGARAYGLDLQPDTGRLAALATRLLEARGSVVADGLDAAECVVGCLSLAPELATARAAVAALVDADQTLPPGLLVRAGLALARAGARPHAARALDRVLHGVALAPRTHFPGESDLARKAQLLDLVVRVAPERAELRGRLATEVLQSLGPHASGTTYAMAQALLALAREALVSAGARPAGTGPAVGPLRARVGDGASWRDVVLGPDNGFRAVVELHAAASLRVEVEAGRSLYAQLVGWCEMDGSGSAGWSAPLVVSRELRPLGTEARDAAARGAWRGRPYELVLRVASHETVEHVCVECPLPAGFEVLGEPSADVCDDRVVTSFDAVGPGRVGERRIVVVPGLVGDVAWPPAVAESMYEPWLSGASPGQRLRIELPRAAAAAATSVTAPLLRLESDAAAALRLVAAVRGGRGNLAVALRELAALGSVSAARLLWPHADEIVECWERDAGDALLALGKVLLALPPGERPLAQGPGLRASRADTVSFLAALSGEERSPAAILALAPLVESEDASALPLATRVRLVRSLLCSGLRDAVGRACVRYGIRDEVDAVPDREVAAWGTVAAALAVRAADRWAEEPEGWETLVAAVAHVPAGPGGGAGPTLRLCERLATSLRRTLRTAVLADVLADGGDCPPEALELVDAADPAAGDAIVRRVLTVLLEHDARPERARAVRRALELLDAKRVAEYLPLLYRALGDPDADVRKVAVDVLPTERLVELPDAVLARLEWSDRVSDCSETERRRLLEHVARTGDVRWPRPLAEAFGLQALAAAPLAALRPLAASPLVLPALRAGRFPARELANELATQREPRWRIALVAALGELPPIDVPFAVGDASAGAFATVLRAFRGDAQAHATVWGWLRTRIYPEAIDGSARDALDELLLASVRDRLAPKELLERAHDLEPEDRARLLARYDRDALAEVLRGVGAAGWFEPEALPEARIDGLRDELFALALESDLHVAGVLARLLGAPERAAATSRKIADLEDAGQRRRMTEAAIAVRTLERQEAEQARETWRAWRRRGL